MEGEGLESQASEGKSFGRRLHSLGSIEFDGCPLKRSSVLSLVLYKYHIG